MSALHARDAVRPFHRSEAFPEDLADLVESATEIAAKRNRRKSKPRAPSLWLATLLPLAAIVLGAALALS